MNKDIIYNPMFKDTVTFIRKSAETHGEVSEMEVTLGAGGGNPLHRHTAFTETFTTIEGILGLSVNGEEIVLKKGESITVQKGQAHRFYNDGDKEVKFNLQFKPGHTGAENMLRIMYGLAQDGLTDKKGVPKSLLTIAVVGELGNSSLAGILSLLTPLLKVLASYGRMIRLDQRLQSKYARRKRAHQAASIL